MYFPPPPGYRPKWKPRHRPYRKPTQWRELVIIAIAAALVGWMLFGEERRSNAVAYACTDDCMGDGAIDLSYRWDPGTAVYHLVHWSHVPPHINSNRWISVNLDGKTCSYVIDGTTTGRSCQYCYDATSFMYRSAMKPF